MSAAPDFKPSFIHPYYFTNWMPFVVRERADGFAIVCRETPTRAIWTTSLIIGGGFVGFAIMIYKYAHYPNWVWADAVLGIITTFGFHFGINAYHRHQQKRGPVLLWDKRTKTATLPRVNAALKADELQFAAVVYGAEGGTDFAAQLQIHTHDGRAYALVVAGNIRQLLPIVRAMERQMGLPVRVFLEKSHRKQLWEERPLASIS